LVRDTGARSTDHEFKGRAGRRLLIEMLEEVQRLEREPNWARPDLGYLDVGPE